MTTTHIDGIDEIVETDETTTCWTCSAPLDFPEDGYCSKACHAEGMHELRALARGTRL